jgi:putative inorganic carbon (HCO3(-)) transporter
VIGIGVFWVFGIFSGHPLWRRTPADFPIMLLALTLPVAFFISPNKEITTPQILRLLSGFALFYGLVQWFTLKNRTQFVLFVTSLVGLALALLAVLTVQWPLEKLSFIPAAVMTSSSIIKFSDAIHPNVMAGYLVFMYPMVIAIPVFSWKQLDYHEKVYYLLATLCIFAVMVFTKSRGALFALGISLAALIILRWRLGWIGITTMGLLSWLAIYLVGADRLASLFLPPIAGIPVISSRIEIWSRALAIMWDFPITGIGMGLYGPLVDRLYPLFINAPGSVPHTHNLFLQVAVDLGIPGLIAWLGIFLTILAASWQVYRTAPRESWQAALGAGLMGSNIALAVHGLTDAVTWGMVRPAPLVWLVWGLAAAALNIYVKPQPAFDTGKV